MESVSQKFTIVVFLKKYAQSQVPNTCNQDTHSPLQYDCCIRKIAQLWLGSASGSSPQPRPESIRIRDRDVVVRATASQTVTWGLFPLCHIK